jgi:hypothetical protein
MLEARKRTNARHGGRYRRVCCSVFVLPAGTGRWRFRLVKRREQYKKAALARTSARSAAYRTKNICRYERRRWPRLGYGGWAAGLIHAVRILSAVVSRARLCAREFAGHTAPRAIFMTASRSGGDHFGVLRTFMTRAFATSGIRSRQHWSRLALVSSQTVRRLSHASNTQHAAPIVQAALAQTISTEK